MTYRYAGKAVPAPLTTPGALQLQTLLAEMKAAGTTDVAMEVTSIALDQGRVAGCRFRVAGLTNVTQDHLDYHGTMDRYFAGQDHPVPRAADAATGWRWCSPIARTDGGCRRTSPAGR